MILNTFSAFIYGHEVTPDKFVIPLDEGSGEIAVEVRLGSYTFSNFIFAIQEALNDFGSNEYEVTADRNTRIITISADANFSLLWGSSESAEISLRQIMGFNLVDLSGSDEYIGNFASGFAYRPQFKLQNFVDFPLIKRSSSPTVKTTASGAVEVVKYADTNFMRCTITLITDIVGQAVIINNPNGVQDAIDFMNYATGKNDLEFIPNVDNFDNFVPCILDSTSEGTDGTSFILEPLYSRGLTGYYELRDLEFRRLK